MVWGETGNYPPLVGMWLPNFVMGALGVYLLVQTANETPDRIGLSLLFIRRLSTRLVGKFSN
jgi:lipopolysaccharide export system permease protein